MKNYKQILIGLDTFIFDMDGVFTDGRVQVPETGDPVRTFNSRDSYAVQHAVKEGLRIIIITGGSSEGARKLFARLGVHEFRSGIADKLRELEGLSLDLSRCAYMGDDIPDLRAMDRVALACCPADAAEEVRAKSHFISTRNGGYGCARDLLEQALKVQGKWMTEHAHHW